MAFLRTSQRLRRRRRLAWVSAVTATAFTGALALIYASGHAGPDAAWHAAHNGPVAESANAASGGKWGAIKPLTPAEQQAVAHTEPAATAEKSRPSIASSAQPAPNAAADLAAVNLATAAVSVDTPPVPRNPILNARDRIAADAGMPILQSVAATAATSRSKASDDVAAKSTQAKQAKSDPLRLVFGPDKTARSKNGKAALPGLKPIRVKVKSGDSLYGILKRSGLKPGVLPALLSVGKHGRRLERIRPGEALDFYIDKAGALQRLEYRPNALTTVSYRRQGDSFNSKLLETPLLKRERKLSGIIESSLFLDGQRAGLSDRVIMQLAQIFGWDVDFALDIRNGDRFTVVHEELLDGKKKVRDGNILAAEFINQGRVFRAVRFESPDGEARYYTPEGRSMRKAFLRTPVKFARISSRFNLRRKHPILHKVRAHKGVDYAAPSGTPVKATGDGRIEFRGRKRGYGNTVIIRHSGGVYSTLYAHLKGFSRKIRHGSFVKQGQVIGYVGKTGLATGPHLHYEFRVRGQHKDPLRVRLPKSLPIAGRYKKAFKQQTRRWLARLGSDGARVAGNN